MLDWSRKDVGWSAAGAARRDSPADRVVENGEVVVEAPVVEYTPSAIGLQTLPPTAADVRKRGESSA
jgi:hypothetical protein